MSTRKQEFSTGEFYHIYNRGNSKQEIFLDEQDHSRFTKLLYLCNSSKRIDFREDVVRMKIDAFDFDTGEPLISIGSWVLMPNHFHILIYIHRDSGNSLSDFMNKLGTAYTMYFNKKYGRTGSLFEGVFKATHLSEDTQLKYNFSYQHLNPVKLIDSKWKEYGIRDRKNALKFLDQYQWSSYHEYRNITRSENKILTPQYFPNYFSTKNLFDEEIFDWLSYRDPLSELK